MQNYMSVRQLGYLNFPNTWQFLSWSQMPTQQACPHITRTRRCGARWHAVSLIKGARAALVGTGSPEKNADVILSQGERRESEVPLRLKPGPK